MPSIVKLEHHHHHQICKAVSEKQFHDLHKKCIICSFEFSVFLNIIKKIELQKENPPDNYSNNYQSVFHSNLLHSSLLLRAPPAIQILTATSVADS